MQKQIIVSAGDSLTAKLVEKMGFDGIWVSGFETSARLGLPDNGSITMTEMLRETEKIVKAVSIPVYVDVDTGYGNYKRTVQEFRDIGAAGICVEDNILPKTNSLWGDKQVLKDPQAMADMLSSVKYKDFTVIARTEALIRGFGGHIALERAKLYAETGVGMVCIHSRDSKGVEALQMALEWKSEVPLCSIPTMFPQVTSDELFKAGYSMVVWANQTERMKLKAITQGLKELKLSGHASSIEDRCISIKELKDLSNDNKCSR